jgi:hypothetical protein
MFLEFFVAAFKAGLPIGLVSYLLVWWALKNDYLEAVESASEVGKAIKRQSKKKKGEERKPADPLHNKWLAFGGGFYGVVGLLTYAVVELGEVRDFFASFNGFADLLNRISFGMLIGLFIEGIKNFVVAIAWPVYWLSDIRSDYIWIWFVVAYLGYWAGTRLAFTASRAGRGSRGWG